MRRNVDVLVASGTPAVLPARDATNVIPIVIVAAIDPIATGVVTSLARPGGNLTGLTAVFADLTGKRLELLKEFFPTLNRVALVSRPANPAHAQYVQQTELAARQLDVALRILALSTPDEFEPAFRDASGVDALIQIDDAMFTSHRRTLVELATKYRIPGSYGLREFVDIGGFMALGPSYPDLYRRAALVVDKILKGANPADLPVQQANTFEMIVNLKTAKALDLDDFAHAPRPRRRGDRMTPRVHHAVRRRGSAWPLAARAQQSVATPLIGVLTTLADKDSEGQLRVAVFRQELQKLGWIEGSNIRFEYRWAAGDAQRLRAYAEELVGMAPAVMLAANNTALRALQEVTRTVPIVFAQVADPVGSGHVASLARPGGNITGFALYEPAIAVKWLELLKEIAPSIARVAIIYDPTDFNSKHMQEIEAVIASFGVQLSSFIIRNVSDIERAIDGFSIQPHGGLIILPGPFTVVHRDLIISLAIRHALPNVHAYRYYPAAGGLASYGVDNVESYLGAASYVDRILKGEKPADLPVQLPKTFRLVINLKSAKALGLEVPPTLLARADEVIE